MSNSSSRIAALRRRSCWRYVALGLLLSLAPPAQGEEWDDVFEFTGLSEVEQPVVVEEAPTASECWDEAEQEFLDTPCEYEGTCHCNGSPSCMQELEATMKCMAENGFVYEVVVPQFYQGVTHGGQDEGFEYGGKVDQFFIMDGGKIWGMEGFGVSMHVETRYGQDVNFDAVGLAPANVAMLYPKFNEHDTAITGLTFSQYVTEEWQAAFGKFNALDLFYALYPQTGRGVNGFMNASMVIPIGIARVVPLSFMGVGVTKYVEKKPVFGLTVFDNQNVTTTSGFDDMFQNGANILAFYRYYTEVGGLPGSHMFGGIWATGEYASFDPLSFVILPGQGVVVDRERGAYSLLYIGEQTLWADACNEKRNVGLLTQWALCDESTSPFAWTCNVAIQGQGLNRSRPQDAIGVGYFHSALSDDFVDSLNPPFNLGDVDGIELYYSAAISACFNVTADLQVIEPAEEQLNTAVVFGLRGVIGL
jgi:porin